MLTPAAVEALIPTASRYIQDGVALWHTIQSARATMAETDRAKLDAQLEASGIREHLDRLSTLTLLLAAEQR